MFPYTAADERYKYDKDFATLVDVLYTQLVHSFYTPGELRQAVVLAATLYESRNIRPIVIKKTDPFGMEQLKPTVDPTSKSAEKTAAAKDDNIRLMSVELTSAAPLCLSCAHPVNRHRLNVISGLPRCSECGLNGTTCILMKGTSDEKSV